MHKETRLFVDAARKGNLRVAARLIATHGLSFRPEWWDGYKFLEIAVKNNKTAFIKLLLSKGCSVKRETKAQSPTLLHFAIRRGNIKIVKLLLSKGADVHGRNKADRTPLALAVKKGCLSGVKLLLKHGSDLNTKDENDVTLLHIASKGNFKEIASALLLRGADASAKTKTNQTPLHIAARSGSTDVVNLLLLHGAQVDCEDSSGNTVLYTAVRRGDIAIVEAVLKVFPDKSNKSNQKCLNIALLHPHKGYVEILDALLDYGFTLGPEDAKDPDLLNGAADKENLELVRELLKYGANVNNVNSLLFDASAPLHSAVKNRHEPMARLFIDYKAEMNVKDRFGKTPLVYSVVNVDLKMTQLLLSNGTSVKDFPQILHLAVQKSSVEIVDALILHGAVVNEADICQRTALHFTVFTENEGCFEIKFDEDHNDRVIDSCVEDNVDICDKFKMAELLLSKGANVDAQTETGATTLHGALEKGYDSFVELLLGYNAKVDLKDKQGVLPLHIAAEKGNKAICSMLLRKGTDVNVKKRDGNTALHLAVSKNHEEVVDFLLENGAYVNCRDENSKVPLHSAIKPGIIAALWNHGAYMDFKCAKGKTAIHYACEEGDTNTVAALLEQGADINISCKGMPFDYAAQRYIMTAMNDPRGEWSRRSQLRDTTHYINQYHVKLDAAGFDHIQTQAFHTDCKIREPFFFECELELTRMKNELVENSTVSYYDILKGSTRDMARYMKNENIVRALESEAYTCVFPAYTELIKSQIRKGLARIKLMEPTARVLRSLNLPELCTEKILNYLDDDDLRILIDSDESATSSQISV